MKRSRIMAAAVVAAAALAWMGPSGAVAGGSDRPDRPVTVDQPLRVLGARADLLIGTAVDMAALAADAPYRERVRTEFSAVTAENVDQFLGSASGRFPIRAAGRLRR